jgi:uncharacterized protein (TIGR00304 family)
VSGLIVASLLMLIVSIVLIAIGVLLIFIDSLRESRREGHRVEAGGVLIIGPLPIVFGTSERVARIVLILAIILTVLAIAMYLILVKL